MDSCKPRNHNGSRSGASNMPAHQHNLMHNSVQFHQRGHKSTGATQMNGYSSHTLSSNSSSNLPAQSSLHYEFPPYKQESQSYIPMGEYLNSPAMPSIGHGGAGGSLYSAHSSRLSGDPHVKRNRGADGMPSSSTHCSHHDDALMELARENLLLKRQLHVASLEVSPHPFPTPQPPPSSSPGPCRK
jgi:hypothetical protein